MTPHQPTIFELMREMAYAEPATSDRRAPLPAAVIPEPEPAPVLPVTPFAREQQVIVSDIDGEWVGKVYNDDGGSVLFIMRPDRPAAIGYPRDQVRALPVPGRLTTDLELLEKERSRREEHRRSHPWVDCFQCRYYSPVDEDEYRCEWLSFPIRRKAPYGNHIGCQKFEEATHGETPIT